MCAYHREDTVHWGIDVLLCCFCLKQTDLVRSQIFHVYVGSTNPAMMYIYLLWFMSHITTCNYVLFAKIQVPGVWVFSLLIADFKLYESCDKYRKFRSLTYVCILITVELVKMFQQQSLFCLSPNDMPKLWYWLLGISADTDCRDLFRALTSPC